MIVAQLGRSSAYRSSGRVSLKLGITSIPNATAWGGGAVGLVLHRASGSTVATLFHLISVYHR